ncbi:MAG: hypothetical protein JWN45_3015 [Acidobacteriaceae bacterium]|nr:hypothetical protein [Acidobacteriaceae bacterium]
MRKQCKVHGEVPPLRYAPVGMTVSTLPARDDSMYAPVGMTISWRIAQELSAPVDARRR